MHQTLSGAVWSYMRPFTDKFTETWPTHFATSFIVSAPEDSSITIQFNKVFSWSVTQLFKVWHRKYIQSTCIDFKKTIHYSFYCIIPSASKVLVQDIYVIIYHIKRNKNVIKKTKHTFVTRKHFLLIHNTGALSSQNLSPYLDTFAKEFRGFSKDLRSGQHQQFRFPIIMLRYLSLNFRWLSPKLS